MKYLLIAIINISLLIDLELSTKENIHMFKEYPLNISDHDHMSPGRTKPLGTQKIMMDDSLLPNQSSITLHNSYLAH